MSVSTRLLTNDALDIEGSEELPVLALVYDIVAEDAVDAIGVGELAETAKSA